MTQNKRSPRNVSWEKKRGDTMAKPPHTGSEMGAFYPVFEATGITRTIEVHDPASRLSFLFDLTYGLTNCGAMSFTSWPCARQRLAQSCAPPQASRPMSTGGSFARKGIRSCRDKRLRNTILPLSSIPTACITRFAMSIPSTLISCFIGLVSCGDMISSDSEIIVAHRSRSAQGRVHFITTPVHLLTVFEPIS